MHGDAPVVSSRIMGSVVKDDNGNEEAKHKNAGRTLQRRPLTTEIQRWEKSHESEKNFQAFHNGNKAQGRSSTWNSPWFVLFLLAIQNCSQFLMMRAAREDTTETKVPSTTVSVFLQEVLKTVISFGMLGWYLSSFRQAIVLFWEQTLRSPIAILSLALPALLYTLQNILLYWAVTYMEAAVAQVLYQAKILSAAVFSTFMLNRSFSKTQLAALAALFLGTAIVQHSLFENTETPNGDYETTSQSPSETDHVKGLVAIAVAVFTSGFCGCYVEKVLKSGTMNEKSRSDGDEESLLWLRNLQLSFISVIMCGVSIIPASNGKGDITMVNFTPMSMAVVLNVSLGGLLTSLVMKYANNVSKGFSTSLSLVASAAISIIFLGKTFSSEFFLGAILVLASTLLYTLS